MSDACFFDSYALYELIKGSSNYAGFKSTLMVFTKLNVFEVYYALLMDGKSDNAETFISEYYDYSVDLDETIIQKAAKFKLSYKERKLSLVDCVGYFVAAQYGIKFLTGDKQFEDLPNVEFVK